MSTRPERSATASREPSGESAAMARPWATGAAAVPKTGVSSLPVEVSTTTLKNGVT